MYSQSICFVHRVSVGDPATPMAVDEIGVKLQLLVRVPVPLS